MEIVHFVENLDRGGLERTVVDLIASQREAGHQCRVICLFKLGLLAKELLASGETYARSSDPTSLGRALQRAGHTAEITTEGAVRSDADLTTVGQIAFDAGLVLSELRAADGAGLEEMFLQLTAETQRDHLQTPEGKAA